MPRYDYHCDENGLTIEVVHGINDTVTNWGELCSRSGHDAGETDAQAPVRRVILTAPMANTPKGDSWLKNEGFTKLVKRSDGTYENVTRTGTEKRFVDPGDASSMPHFNKKISD